MFDLRDLIVPMPKNEQAQQLLTMAICLSLAQEISRLADVDQTKASELITALEDSVCGVIKLTTMDSIPLDDEAAITLEAVENANDFFASMRTACLRTQH